MAASDEHALLLQISYDLARLEKQGRQAQGIVDKSLSAVEQRAKRTAKQLEESFSLKGFNPGAAITQVFGGLRNTTLDEGASKLGVLGGALEALGPAGLAAAAGVAAAAFAIDQAMKGAEWAEDIERASKALGVTTTQLQEFDFIAQATGQPIEKMRDSLSGLVKTIGLVESGLSRSMQTKAFTDGLKITPEQLRGWGTLDQQLPHILDAMSKLDAEERAGLASRLKIDPQVLNSLIEARESLSGLIAKAHEYGIVMDEATIKKTAEAAQEMHVAKAIIDGELRAAFINLAPMIAKAAQALADGSRDLRDFTTGVGLALKPIGDFVGWIDQLAKKLGGVDLGKLGQLIGLMTNPLAGITAAGRAKREQDEKVAGWSEWIKQNIIGGAQPKPVKLSDGSKKRAGSKRDDTDSLTRTATSDLESADRAYQEAMKALTTDVAERAKYESRAIDDEAAKQQAKLTADRAELLKNKTIDGKTSDILQAKIEQAQSEVEKTRLAKQALLKLQTEQALADQAFALRQVGLEGERNLLEAEKAVAKTTEQRRQLALKLFALDEEIEEAKLKEVIASKTASEAEKQRAQAELDNLRATKQLREKAVSEANPGNSWDAWLQDAQKSTRDVGEAFAKMRVDGVEAFNRSLFDSEGRLQSFGNIARSVARTFITDFEQWGIKGLESQLFGGGNGQGGILSNLFGGSQGGQGGIGGILGSIFGGGKGGGPGASGVTRPTGTAADPIYVAFGGAGAGGGLQGLGGLFGGGQGGGGLGSLFGGSGGGGLGSIFSSIGSIFGFDSGGSFTVGGPAGRDRSLAMMRVGRGEKVTVETAAQQRSGRQGGITQVFNFPGANPDGFRQTRRQWAREAKLAVAY